MKILHVTFGFPPDFRLGGSIQSTYYMSKSMAELGHEVTVFTTNLNDDINKDCKLPHHSVVDGMNVFYQNNINKGFMEKSVQITPSMISLCKKMISQFNIVHIHDYRTSSAAIAYYYANKYNVPYIVQPHGSLPIFDKQILKKIFDSAIGTKMLSKSKHIISSSHLESSYYEKTISGFDNSKVVYIPNGLNADITNYHARPGNFREKYGINMHSKIILFVGRLHPMKGVDILINAFSNICTKVDDAYLFIVGPDGGHLDYLKELVHHLGLEKRIIFTGPLHNEEKLAAYVDSDVFVLPSKSYESFGNVILEAASFGIPVVVTRYCGISEWINDDIGYVVEPKVQDIEAGILVALEGKNSFSIRKNRKIIENHFNWKKIAEEIVSLY